MNKKIYLNIAFSLILLGAKSHAAELSQNDKTSDLSSHEEFVLADQYPALQTDEICDSEARILAIFEGFLRWKFDRMFDFCELAMLLNANASLPSTVKASAFDTLPNATEEEIRRALELIQLKIIMGITPSVALEPRCVPNSLSNSRKRIRRNSAVF